MLKTRCFYRLWVLTEISEGNSLSPVTDGRAGSETRDIRLCHARRLLSGVGPGSWWLETRWTARLGVNPSTSLGRGEWKPVEFEADDSVGLQKLQNDPDATKDLAETMPEQAADRRAKLDAWQARLDAPIPKRMNPECVLDDAAEGVNGWASNVDPSEQPGQCRGEEPSSGR